jgi:hypothetical protein
MPDWIRIWRILGLVEESARLSFIPNERHIEHSVPPRSWPFQFGPEKNASACAATSNRLLLITVLGYSPPFQKASERYTGNVRNAHRLPTCAGEANLPRLRRDI